MLYSLHNSQCVQLVVFMMEYLDVDEVHLVVGKETLEDVEEEQIY